MRKNDGDIEIMGSMIGRIIKALIKNSLREIQTEIYTNYIKSSRQVLPPGIDAVPIEGDQGIVIVIDESQGKTISIGVYPDPQAESGEVRLYSRDDTGTLQAYSLHKKDGVLELNGNTDFAVAFNDLKSGFDQLKLDHNAFLLHVHGAAGTPPVPPAIPSTASIDAAKIATVKVP